MDKEQLLAELNQQISGQIHHEIEHALESPAHINRVIGESMRHIGSFLEISSAAYLPVRPEEVLATPVKMRDDSADAVLLLTRTINSDNAFLVLANGKTVGENRQFDLVAYKADGFNLNKTKFIQLPQEVGTEIIRQLNLIVKGDGAALLQCVVVKEYFKEQVNENDSLFSSDTAAPPAPSESIPLETPKPPSALPPVNTDNLL